MKYLKIRAKIRGETISPKGKKLVRYLAKIVFDPAYQPQTLSEKMLEEDVVKVMEQNNMDRLQTAYSLLAQLLPLCDKSVLDEED